MNWILTRVWEVMVNTQDFSVPLSIIFNSPLQSGSLPTRQFSSICIPIFKKSSRYDSLNYRLISLTSVTCKVLKRAVSRHLTSYLEENSYFSSKIWISYGTLHCYPPIMTQEDITLKSVVALTTDLIFFDFVKAFDMVMHKLLLLKLICSSIEGLLLQWIEMVRLLTLLVDLHQ